MLWKEENYTKTFLIIVQNMKDERRTYFGGSDYHYSDDLQASDTVTGTSIWLQIITERLTDCHILMHYQHVNTENHGR